MLVQQACLLTVAAVRSTNLTAEDTLTPPSYITSPSGAFALGFAHDSDPTKFLLATWFHLGGGNGNSSSKPRSRPWEPRPTPRPAPSSLLSTPPDDQHVARVCPCVAGVGQRPVLQRRRHRAVGELWVPDGGYAPAGLVSQGVPLLQARKRGVHHRPVQPSPPSRMGTSSSASTSSPAT